MDARRQVELCAACHAADGTGMQIVGAPNLTDDIWLHGGRVEDIESRVRSGIVSQMPAHGEILGEQKVMAINENYGRRMQGTVDIHKHYFHLAGIRILPKCKIIRFKVVQCESIGIGLKHIFKNCLTASIIKATSLN